MMDTDTNDDSYLHRTYPITTYGVWVSEIMLQQTRVEAVIVKWCQFMSKFPNVVSLANAQMDDLNAIWAGLGYYRRLKLLHNAAQMVVDKYNGIIPNTVEELLTLPGIGRYTANAIASIAYQQTVPVVDGNVCRVLSRLRIIAQTIKSPLLKDQYGWELAHQIVSANNVHSVDHNTTTAATTATINPGDINQALMELGATYCSPSGTGIHPNDPLKDFYWSTKLGIEFANSLCNISASANDDSFLLKQESTSDYTPHCQLCASTGVHDIVTQFHIKLKSEVINLRTNGLNFNNNINENDSIQYYNAVRQLGHSLFPIPPLKVHKKEDLLIVAALCRFNTNTNIDGIEQRQWLLTKRPDNGGLLSGQWEFPSVCVWQSEDDKDKSGKKRNRTMPRPDMSNHVPIIPISERQNHLHILLRDIFITDDILKNLNFQTVNVEPMHHIFSHVRHTLYIECATLDKNSTISITHNNDDANDDATKTTIRWMSRDDMDQIGITSGVKKILDSVEKFTNIIPIQRPNI
jgi:A/G-specific adenine glycosylase